MNGDSEDGMTPEPKPKRETKKVEVGLTLNGELKDLGGSMSQGWNDHVLDQAMNTFWLKGIEDLAVKKFQAAGEAMFGIAPKDEVEGMLAAQLIACHNVSMECYRRAMLPDQSFEGRRENLNQANKLSRTYATLVESLNRHRGKGQQKVTVEHVHVHEGGQAIVGNVEGQGGGFASKSKEQPHALAHTPGQTMPSADAARDRVPVALNEERPVPDARRNVARRAKGK